MSKSGATVSKTLESLFQITHHKRAHQSKTSAAALTKTLLEVFDREAIEK
jgi:hypothetical protein